MSLTGLSFSSKQAGSLSSRDTLLQVAAFRARQVVANGQLLPIFCRLPRESSLSLARRTLPNRTEFDRQDLLRTVSGSGSDLTGRRQCISSEREEHVLNMANVAGATNKKAEWKIRSRVEKKTIIRLLAR